ncbi:hypothetical protein E2C01_044407 [Portunus trituberculatus]|uniref:Uncharacterized protein n=1 Tax=Portunus trituberculatus TaxID=210409 RepID=A0A5B7G0D1_PORTR|nr:hypothetical protein [Portunus trituberculatus]
MSEAPLYQEMTGCGREPLAVQDRSRRSPARTEPPTAAPVISTVKGRTAGVEGERGLDSSVKRFRFYC